MMVCGARLAGARFRWCEVGWVVYEGVLGNLMLKYTSSRMNLAGGIKELSPILEEAVHQYSTNIQ